VRFAKAILVNPPSPPGYEINKDSMGGFGQLYPAGVTILPPLDLPYLAGYLADKNVPLEVLECQGLGLTPDALARRVSELAGRENGVRSLVVVRTSAPTLDWDLAACAQLKSAVPQAAVAIYGAVVPHVRQRLYRETILDYIVLGEPDQTVHELMTGRSEGEILGLIYRRGEQWIEQPERPFLKELDELPFPKWELFPYQRYALPRSSTKAALPFLPMLTSRGCPFGCHYCPYPVGQGLPWRFRSPRNVVDEIEHLVKDLGIQYILFRDPMFSLRLSRVMEICKEIERRGLVFKWKCETRPDYLDEPTLRAMAAAGCEGINFGVESADVAIQAGVGRKPISQEVIISRVALCRELGIKTFCFFIIGLPGDTVDTILGSIAFAVRIRPNWVQFTAATPFIGTKLRDWAVARGMVTAEEYAYINSHTTTLGNENLTQSQIAALYRFAKFYERYLINRGGILKDETRRGVFYRTALKLADRSAHVAAEGLLRLRRRHYERLCVKPA
jgi:anaerobic magnesium-protoporphyrin IX monomethyl ester cyclase